MRTFKVTATLLCSVLLASLTVVAQTPQSPEEQQKENQAKRAEFKKKAATLVASEQERAKYADFLKAPNTGLIRLLPREKYITEAYADVKPRVAPAAPGSFSRKTLADTGSNIPPDQPPGQERGPSGGGSTARANANTNLDDLPLLGPAQPNNKGKARDGGAYYSFTRLTHEYGYGSDLSLQSGQFSVGFAGADYGFITNLGNVPLESIDLDTPEVQPLGAYTRAEKEADARLEYRRFQQGAVIDGVSVQSRIPLQLNSTYLLRAINYGASDVLVAFRVVEIDADGTPLILWKRLKVFDATARPVAIESIEGYNTKRSTWPIK